MNSLEFIKQHVKEWSSNSEQVILCTDGDVIFANSKSPTPVHRVDLSEHFAPSYYDGKVWTREEFEACGKLTVNWDNAPSWATSYGVGVGIGSRHVWYNHERYAYADEPAFEYRFDNGGSRDIDEITHYASRPTPSIEPSSVSSNKYERELTDRQGNSATIDVYDVLQAFNVTCPATQHAVKKLLCTGVRGHKDGDTDLLEARESITRAIELRG